jgi:hypothetical protein
MLPKLNKRTYEVFLPCSKQTISYRGFSVGEEKLILVFQEESKSDSENSPSFSKNFVSLIKQIIWNCTFEKIDTTVLPLSDVEVLFIAIRKVSVGEETEILPICQSCGKSTPVKYSLNDIQLITNENHNNTVELEEGCGVVFKYPTLPMIDIIRKESEFVNILIECTDKIWDGDKVYEFKDLPRKEIEDFYMSMTKDHVEKIYNQFLNTLPKSVMNIHWKCDHCEKENDIFLEGFVELFR